MTADQYPDSVHSVESPARRHASSCQLRARLIRKIARLKKQLDDLDQREHAKNREQIMQDRAATANDFCLLDVALKRRGWIAGQVELRYLRRHRPAWKRKLSGLGQTASMSDVLKLIATLQSETSKFQRWRLPDGTVFVIYRGLGGFAQEVHPDRLCDCWAYSPHICDLPTVTE